MSNFDDTEERILDYLRESARGGERYFRSKNIAAALELSAKQVGTRLPRLAEKADDVEIEKWSRSRSTTWRVEPA